MTVETRKKTRWALKLQCKVQTYDWGRLGMQSEVGRLYAMQSGSTLSEDKPYAELWMGTHESGPSLVVLDDEEEASLTTIALKDWLSQNPQALGDKSLELWGADLPFLFKVLSIAKALSIQAHPDKKLAKQLHLLYPNIYKDGNHKPEMALAISPFEALCGFMSSQDIKQVLVEVPELHCVLGETVVKALMKVSQSKELAKVPLRAAFTSLTSADQEVVVDAMSDIVSRLIAKKQTMCLTSKEQLVLRLADQYPGDVGVLSALFLNYISLAPGEALYLDANEPHAYIAGECVECMATSDNVVRAGLTPKYKDMQTLCAMLSYKQGKPDILPGVQVNPYTRRYTPPFQEFEVDMSIVPHGAHVTFPAIAGPLVVLVLEGEGIMEEFFDGEKHATTLKKGSVFFVPAGVKLKITAVNLPYNTLHVYKAGVSSAVLSTDS